MRIKGGWQYLIGKRIEAVVTVSPINPSGLARVHLVLDGEVNFEIYSPTGEVWGASFLHPGDLPEVLDYACIRPLAEVFGERRVVPR